MNARSSRWLVIYGFLLIGLGVLTVALLGPRAKTGLYSGAGVGAFSILWGILMARGAPWALPVAIGNLGFGALAFGWRAFVSFLALLDGRPDRLAPALISTVMCAGAAAVFAQLLRQWREEEAAGT